MRSQMANASAWSCVTNSAVMPVRSSSERISVRIESRSRVSRFDSGSSNSSTSGSIASARAIATRWRWPPDIWWTARGP